MKCILFFTCLLCTSLMAHAQKEKKTSEQAPDSPQVEAARFPGLKDFLQRNPEVAKVYWKTNDTIVLKMKDKTTRLYDLSNETTKKGFNDKYGDPPVPPPPPPPAPPPPPPKEKLS
ncbi:MAG: hypothetical protein QM763_08760 [Agriterribacter sp.]